MCILKHRDTEHAFPRGFRSVTLPPIRPWHPTSFVFQIWLASTYLLLYAVYATIVFRSPRGGTGPSSEDGLEAGGLGSGLDDHAVDARWM